MMKDAYDDYGFQMPLVFFTDNVAGDKTFLESIFSSLKEDLKPLQDDEISFVRSSVDLELPERVEIRYIRNSKEMNLKMKELLEKVRGSANEATLGFDAEWVVIADKSLVDVMQIAYKNVVYVLHIPRSWYFLPPHLKEFLADEKVKKVGRNVGGNLKIISKGYEIVCKGALELGLFCSVRKCIPSGRLSLSEISSIVLGAKISKNERLSNWDAAELT
jgi:hypothetical protein